VIQALRQSIFCFFILQTILSAQVLFASHLSIHPVENIHIGHQGHGHSSHQDQGDSCQVCSSLQALYNQIASKPPVIPVIAFTYVFLAPASEIAKPQTTISAYTARAPPSLFS